MFNKIDYYFKRGAAYSIDILLISIVVNCFISSDKINIQYNTYNKYIKEYYEFYLPYYEHNYNNSEVDTCSEFKEAIDTYKLTEKKYVDDFEKINNSLEKEEITKDEYNEKCSSLVKKYMDDAISKKEYEEKENYYLYHLEKNYVVAYLINLAVVLLYFVLFQGFTYGQTLGKKIMRLKVVDLKGDKVSYKALFIRSIFLFSIIYYVLEILATFVVPMKYFTYSYNTLTLLNTVLSIIIIISIFVSKEHKGLHGLISKTKVVLLDFKGNVVDIASGKTQVELEEEKKSCEEENKKIKKSNRKKPSNKKRNG